jgi:hypothetical protein
MSKKHQAAFAVFLVTQADEGLVSPNDGDLPLPGKYAARGGSQ